MIIAFSLIRPRKADYIIIDYKYDPVCYVMLAYLTGKYERGSVG